MPNLLELENAMPVAPLKIIALPGAKQLGERINEYLVAFRKEINNVHKNDPAFQGYIEDNYLVKYNTPRFGSGEGKGFLPQPGEIRCAKIVSNAGIIAAGQKLPAENVDDLFFKNHGSFPFFEGIICIHPMICPDRTAVSRDHWMRFRGI